MKVLKAFRLDKDLVEKLEAMAKNEHRTLSNLVSKILSDFANIK